VPSFAWIPFVWAAGLPLACSVAPFLGDALVSLEGGSTFARNRKGWSEAEENPQPLYRAVSAPARFFSVTQIGVEVDCLSLRE
jgi:hypothetical protein